jgi:3-methylcrotonyl-CoA carboxylase beta subunit
VLCDKILMTEGSGLYLAGPQLVKAAIGQETDPESLGGAAMHAEISRTVDFKEKDDPACLKRLRSLISLLPAETAGGALGPDNAVTQPDESGRKAPPTTTEFPASRLLGLGAPDGRGEYDVRDLLRCLIDAGSMDESRTDSGKSIVTAYARLGGRPVGIVANQRMRVHSKTTGLQMPGVIYADSADKAARFIMDCNQTRLPLLFLQDVSGFMVGRDAEQSGIIRSGAKMVNALSNSTVPKITVITGGSHGAGNYAMCGKAFDPRFIFAWPDAKYAVMGAAQASDVVYGILAKAAKDRSPGELDRLRQQVKENYTEQADIRYAAARGWVDAIIPPAETRAILLRALALASRPAPKAAFHTGVFQV